MLRRFFYTIIRQHSYRFNCAAFVLGLHYLFLSIRNAEKGPRKIHKGANTDNEWRPNNLGLRLLTNEAAGLFLQKRSTLPIKNEIRTALRVQQAKNAVYC